MNVTIDIDKDESDDTDPFPWHVIVTHEGVALVGWNEQPTFAKPGEAVDFAYKWLEDRGFGLIDIKLSGYKREGSQ